MYFSIFSVFIGLQITVEISGIQLIDGSTSEFGVECARHVVGMKMCRECDRGRVLEKKDLCFKEIAVSYQ